MNLFAIVFFFIIGSVIRKKEKDLINLLDQIIQYRNISIRQTAMTMGLSESRIRKLIDEIRNMSLLSIQVDQEFVKYQGPSQPRQTQAVNNQSSMKAENINTQINNQTNITPDAGVQQYSDSKGIKLNELTKAGFNIIIFIILFFTIWLAAFYYFYHYYQICRNKKLVNDKMSQ